MALAGSSPTRTTASPGFTPRATSLVARSTTFARTFFAIARPSMRSAGKVHCSRLPDQNDFDLPRILELGLDTPGDFFCERSHPRIVDLLGRNDDSNFAPRLDRKHLFDPAIARGDLLQTLE